MHGVHFWILAVLLQNLAEVEPDGLRSVISLDDNDPACEPIQVVQPGTPR
jgi:hypothetical protein